MPNASHTIEIALVKLVLGAVISLGLLILFLFVSRYFKGLVLAGDCLAFLITLLLSIDASRVIKRERRSGETLRILGAALGFPQLVLGIVMLGIGVVYPFFGIYKIYSALLSSGSVLFPFLGTIMAIFLLGLGYCYVREGLSLIGKEIE